MEKSNHITWLQLVDRVLLMLVKIYIDQNCTVLTMSQDDVASSHSKHVIKPVSVIYEETVSYKFELQLVDRRVVLKLVKKP